MFIRPSDALSDAPSRRTASPAATPEPALPPPPAETHWGMGRLLDCLICLCPRLRRTPAERPAVATATTTTTTTAATAAPEPGTFQPPALPPDQTVRVTRLKMHPLQARFRIQPSGFLTRDALLVYQLPNFDFHTRYHECQDGARCGLHMINMLGMALTGNDYGALASRARLDDFVRARHGSDAGNHYLDEDLRDFHNHGRRVRPALALAAAAVMHDGTIDFGVTRRTTDAADTIVTAEIDAAPAVGLSFHFDHGDRATLNSVVVRRTGETLFELLDSRTPQLHYAHASRMTTALAVFVRKLGWAEAGPEPVRRYNMLYPTAALPKPLGSFERIDWL